MTLNPENLAYPAHGSCFCLQGTLDNINLFSCITIISFFLLLPVALLTEGVRFTPAAMRAAGLVPGVVMKQAILAAVCFHAYQQARPDPDPGPDLHSEPLRKPDASPKWVLPMNPAPPLRCSITGLSSSTRS